MEYNIGWLSESYLWIINNLIWVKNARFDEKQYLRA
jgi:hypothetical protein